MAWDKNKIVDHLQAKARERKYRLTSHAEKEREADQITQREINEALLSESCEVIEDYPTDPRGHSCLVLGFTHASRPIHMVCGNLVEDDFIVITMYRPDPSEWIEWRIRKEQQ